MSRKKLELPNSHEDNLAGKVSMKETCVLGSKYIELHVSKEDNLYQSTFYMSTNNPCIIITYSKILVLYQLGSIHICLILIDSFFFLIFQKRDSFLSEKDHYRYIDHKSTT